MFLWGKARANVCSFPNQPKLIHNPTHQTSYSQHYEHPVHNYNNTTTPSNLVILSHVLPLYAYSLISL